ncbi:hypothetical protein Tco_0563383 [Tanacetum coccineum]
MNTLAEHIIVARAKNRPPMIEKSMYDSLANRIRLFIKGKKHGRMMLDSIDNGPLVYPAVEENRQTRPKKYSELTEAQQLQDECDVQEKISFFTVFHPILVVPMFKQGEDPIECINKAMTFLFALASRFPPSNNQLRTLSNLRNQTTIQDGRVTIQQIQGRQNQSYAGTRNKGITTTSKGNVAAGQPRVKLMFAEAQEVGQILDEEQLAFLADPVLSEAPYSNSYPNDMINQDVQEMQYSEQTHVDDFQDNEIRSGSNIILYSQYLQESQDAIKDDFGKCFVTQKVLSAEQAFWLKHSSLSETPVTSHTLVIIEAPSELPKCVQWFTMREKDFFMPKGIKQSPLEKVLLKSAEKYILFSSKDCTWGGQLNAAPVLEVENFTNWNKRFMCHIIGIETQFENIISKRPFVPMAAGQRNPEAQWTTDERKAANLDQRLKSLIMSVLPDDQMNSDFQDSPDDEEDTRSSHEYLNDLEEEYQAKALLAKSKRFFKKGTQRFSSAKATNQTKCHKCGKKGMLNTTLPSLSSENKLEMRNTKDFEAKYNKVKAKLALLSSSASAPSSFSSKNKGLIVESYDWDKEEVSSDDEETEVKALMALTYETEIFFFMAKKVPKTVNGQRSP